MPLKMCVFEDLIVLSFYYINTKVISTKQVYTVIMKVFNYTKIQTQYKFIYCEIILFNKGDFILLYVLGYLKPNYLVNCNIKSYLLQYKQTQKERQKN